jgi:uncharacterized protein (UPF0248 family)
MQPLHELLHRIQWDPEFGAGEFALGYDDRIAGRVVIVPFTSVSIGAGRRGVSVHAGDGSVAQIPLHRVRTVFRNGIVIWQRPERPAGDAP